MLLRAKRFHYFSYQSLTALDGFVFAMYGPDMSRWHDLTLLRNSNWDNELQERLNANGKQFYMYGGGAYKLKPWIQRPVLGILNTQEKDFNWKMSVRVSVEHTYKDFKQMRTSQDFAWKLETREAPESIQ